MNLKHPAGGSSGGRGGGKMALTRNEFDVLEALAEEKEALRQAVLTYEDRREEQE